MTLSEEQKKDINEGLAFASVCIIVFWFGWMFGDLRGYDRAMEDDKKYACLAKYNSVPFEKIEGQCLKYYQINNK